MIVPFRCDSDSRLTILTFGYRAATASGPRSGFMSAAASTDKYAMGSIGSSLTSARDALSDLAQQIKQRDAAKVQGFQAYVVDVPKEKITEARYIGDLRPNQNRLNVFSLASMGDSDDNYRFNLKSTGNVHLNLLVDELDAQRQVVKSGTNLMVDQLDAQGQVVESETATGLGIQVIQYQGSRPVVIADSAPHSGAAKQMFDKMAGDGADLKAGKYVVRIYRQENTSANTEYSYSFQLVGDRYYQDYDTTEREAPAHPTKSALDYMTVNPAVGLLADSTDATMGAVMVAATRPPTLIANGDTTTDPVTLLLDSFM
jgi:hypothetical protein